MNLEHLYHQHQHLLEDFWGRRTNGPRFEERFHLFGRPVHATSNHEGVLAAVARSRQLFSVAAPVAAPAVQLHLVVRRPPYDPGPPPEDLFSVIQYTGHDQWLALLLGQWGQAHVDLAAGRALAILSPPLAERPDIVSRCVLNTLFLNLFIGRGFGLLHATGLLRGERAILLVAPHNSGKSTTALRLVMAGYLLLSDSQIYLSPDHDGLQLLGFPVGLARLRQDMLADFPYLAPFLEPEPVRDEIKYSVNLRRLDPALCRLDAVYPAAVELCLLSRSDEAASRLSPARREEAMAAVMANSLYYDTAVAWQRNLAPIERLVDQARWSHLAVGSDPNGIRQVVDALCQ